MCSWVNFYRGLANEARERAARASNLSIKDKFEEVAKEWSALAVWAELANLQIEDYALGAKGCQAIGYARQPQQISLAPEAFSLSRGLYATDRFVNKSLSNRIPPPRAVVFGPTATVSIQLPGVGAVTPHKLISRPWRGCSGCSALYGALL